MFKIFRNKKNTVSKNELPEEPFLSKAELPAPKDLGINHESAALHPPSERDILLSEQKQSWLNRLKQNFIKSRSAFSEILNGVKLNDELYENLEEALITADMGVAATAAILDNLKSLVQQKKIKDELNIRKALANIIQELLTPLESELKIDSRPTVIMLIGVNGAGKTTTIGKLAKYLKSQKQKILLAAGDTFRAAAREQLIGWGEQNQIPIIEKPGCDPASVIFDAIDQAKKDNVDVVLADTAGRLSTQKNLMDELIKIKRVIGKIQPGAPHEILLVIDGSNGQNALSQVIAFSDALNVTGLVITKLDSGAKGGILAAIARIRPIPVYFLGLGERLDDLQPFNAESFTNALFDIQ